jgi:hypothetical protein
MKQVVLPPTLGNLVRTLAYHRRQQDLEPMGAADVEQNNRIVTELSSTLKTIFKL